MEIAYVTNDQAEYEALERYRDRIGMLWMVMEFTNAGMDCWLEMVWVKPITTYGLWYLHYSEACWICQYIVVMVSAVFILQQQIQQ